MAATFGQKFKHWYRRKFCSAPELTSVVRDQRDVVREGESYIKRRKNVLDQLQRWLQKEPKQSSKLRLYMEEFVKLEEEINANWHAYDDELNTILGIPLKGTRLGKGPKDVVGGWEKILQDSRALLRLDKRSRAKTKALDIAHKNLEAAEAKLQAEKSTGKMDGDPKVMKLMLAVEKRNAHHQKAKAQAQAAAEEYMKALLITEQEKHRLLRKIHTQAYTSDMKRMKFNSEINEAKRILVNKLVDVVGLNPALDPKSLSAPDGQEKFEYEPDHVVGSIADEANTWHNGDYWKKKYLEAMASHESDVQKFQAQQSATHTQEKEVYDELERIISDAMERLEGWILHEVPAVTKQPLNQHMMELCQSGKEMYEALRDLIHAALLVKDDMMIHHDGQKMTDEEFTRSHGVWASKIHDTIKDVIDDTPKIMDAYAKSFNLEGSRFEDLESGVGHLKSGAAHLQSGLLSKQQAMKGAASNLAVDVTALEHVSQNSKKLFNNASADFKFQADQCLMACRDCQQDVLMMMNTNKEHLQELTDTQINRLLLTVQSDVLKLEKQLDQKRHFLGRIREESGKREGSGDDFMRSTITSANRDRVESRYSEGGSRHHSWRDEKAKLVALRSLSSSLHGRETGGARLNSSGFGSPLSSQSINARDSYAAGAAGSGVDSWGAAPPMPLDDMDI